MAKGPVMKVKSPDIFGDSSESVQRQGYRDFAASARVMTHTDHLSW